MVRESIFNKIWIIESLPDGDLKTGTALVENELTLVKQKKPGLRIALEKPSTKSELATILQKIHDEAREGWFPILHLECHGCPNGIAMTNGELVKWNELSDILVKINEACRLNLVIILAACNGAHLIKVSEELDRAPFLAIIGPESEVTSDEIEKDFSAFYKAFFENLNWNVAINVLNNRRPPSARTYHFLSAEKLFLMAYSRYYKHHCIGKGRRARIERLTTEAMKNPHASNRGINWTRNEIKKGLASPARDFEEFRDRFFFMDYYPENRHRFPLQWEDILRDTQQHPLASD